MLYQIISLLCFEALYYLVLCTLLFPNYRKYYVPAKMICSTGFLVVAVLMTYKSGNYSRALILAPIFILCYLGDLFLGFKHKENASKIFLILGTISFLLAHTYFAILFIRSDGIKFYDLIAPILSVVFVYITSKKDEYNLGKFLPMAAVYGCVLSLLTFKSITHVLKTGLTSDIFIAVGAIFFLVSDVFVYILYFRRTRPWPIHGLNLATYYFAMVCFAFSIYY